MKTFARGQKGKLDDLGVNRQLMVSVDIALTGASVDVSCFGLDSQDKLSDERFMIFFNQTSSPADAIVLDQSSGKAVFRIDLEKLPASIIRMVFTAAIDGPGTMSAIRPGAVLLGDAVSFDLKGSDFQAESAVILADLYRKDEVWRFGAVGQGFNGGLPALLTYFGGTQAHASAAPSPVSQQATPAPAPSKVSLSKVTLDKRGDKVSLEKRGTGFGRIRVNLNWNQQTSGSEIVKKGFFGRVLDSKKTKAIDLDLACLYELSNGRAGGVQALGEAWGNFENAPFIHLEGDDRSGESNDGENIFINGVHFEQIKRILIFSFIYEGVPNWAATDGVVTIEVPGQGPVEVKMDGGGNQMLCAVAMIENHGGKLQVTKLVEYFAQQGKITAHEMMDRRFGFNLHWSEGRKS